MVEVQLPNMAFSDNIVYEALLRLITQNEGKIITRAMIRDACGIAISRATINRALNRLETTKQITRIHRPKERGNIYRIGDGSEPTAAK